MEIHISDDYKIKDDGDRIFPIMKLYDKDNNLLIETAGYFGNTIEPGETKQIISDVTEDLRSTTRVEYKIAR